MGALQYRTSLNSSRCRSDDELSSTGRRGKTGCEQSSPGPHLVVLGSSHLFPCPCMHERVRGYTYSAKPIRPEPWTHARGAAPRRSRRSCSASESPLLRSWPPAPPHSARSRPTATTGKAPAMQAQRPAETSVARCAPTALDALRGSGTGQSAGSRRHSRSRAVARRVREPKTHVFRRASSPGHHQARLRLPLIHMDLLHRRPRSRLSHRPRPPSAPLAPTQSRCSS